MRSEPAFIMPVFSSNSGNWPFLGFLYVVRSSPNRLRCARYISWMAWRLTSSSGGEPGDLGEPAGGDEPGQSQDTQALPVDDIDPELPSLLTGRTSAPVRCSRLPGCHRWENILDRETIDYRDS